jgi:MipA family protein
VTCRPVLIAFTCLACGGPAVAADAPPVTSPEPATGWIVTMGANFSAAPRYDGAALYGAYALPSFSIRRADEPAGFSAPDDGFDFTLFGNERFAIGPVANLRGGRYRSSNHDLIGLRDVPWTVEGGVFAEFWPVLDRLRLRLEVRHGFRGRADGFVADLSSDWVQKFGKFILSGGPRASFADSDYMDANFGVLPREAAVNRRVYAYDPGPGLKSVGWETALSYPWSKAWTTTGYLRYDRLVRDAAASPIVHRMGSRDQLTVGTEITYSFAIGR